MIKQYHMNTVTVQANGDDDDDDNDDDDNNNNNSSGFDATRWQMP